MYEYSATVVSVYDGDTFRADIDLGFGVCQKNQPIRVYGIDTPELGTEEGKTAKAFAESLLIGKTVKISTIKDKKEKYGRYLGVISLPSGEDYADLMIKNGCGEAYFGGKKTDDT